jgi:N-carbamoyl-L-amino-acid hydrolase
MKPSSNLPVDAGRLWDDLMALAAITDPGRPWTRRAFSPLFAEGRSFLRRRFEEAGLTCRVDAAGNLIGRHEGTDSSRGTILVGSHSDTVPDGGRFDGPAGVVAGLELVRSLDERGIRLTHAVEVVDYLAEEPSPYGLSCIGSRGMAGALTEDHLKLTDDAGEALGTGIERAGGSVALLAQAKRSDIAAAFELHIEQGPFLEAERIDIGVVTAIAGILRLEVLFTGAADHAGTTPFTHRRDASLAAAYTILAVRAEAERCAASGHGYFVATTGIVAVEPNAANVVPRTARIVVDARFVDSTLAARFTAALDEATAQAAATARVDRRFSILSDSPPSHCDAGLRDILSSAATDLGLSMRPMTSGAGHDTAFLTRIAPAAMVFVPCRDGRSHTPEEWAEPEAIAAGAAVLLEAVIAFDRGAAARDPQRSNSERTT